MADITDSLNVSRHRVVRVVTSQHRFEPLPLNIDGFMSPPIQLLPDPMKEGPPTLALGLAPELKPPAILHDHANVREPKEVESLRLSQSSLRSAFYRKAAELDQSSLLRMQRQPKLGESLRQILQELNRL